MSRRHTEWPAAVESARASLQEALAASPRDCEGCEALAFELGMTLRGVGARGEDACRLLQEAIGYDAPSWSLTRDDAFGPRGRLMLAAVDAFYGVRPHWQSGMPSSLRAP